MLLRRITEHVRSQNWFAVGIDFVIVVVGVLFALMAEQWLRNTQQSATLASAEVAINIDLYENYFNATEVLTLEPCRKERTRLLSELLLRSDEPWPGLPWAASPGAFNSELPEVLPTPYRLWGSSVWDAEVDNGTVSVMDVTRRGKLDAVFTGSQLAQNTQEVLFLAQSRLKTLAIAKDIDPVARARYLETLHFHDEQSGLQVLAALKVIKDIEEVGMQKDDSIVDEFRDYMPDYNLIRQERYGDCFVPIVLPYLENQPARG